MATVVTPGDRLLTVTGRASWLKRPSVPLSSFYGGGSLRLSGAGSISYTQLYRTQPWVAISINKLSRQIARLPLKTYELDSQGDRVRVREGPLPDLLCQPWERGSASSLKQAISFPALLHGNSVLGKRRKSKGAPPTSFEILDWRYLCPQTEYDWGGRVLFWKDESDGERFVAPEEVIHTGWLAPEGEIGVSPLEQLGITLRGEDAAQRYSSASFGNAVRPSGALVTPPEVNLDREERQEIRDEIAAAHQGVDQAFRLMLLTGGLDFKPFSQTAKEAELIEARKLAREEVAAVYDIPPPLIGILDHATYSNVTEMHRMLYVTVLGPWLDLIEQTIQAQLIDPEPAFEGLFCEFDLGEVLKGDTKERISALKEGIQTGLYTINDARKIENLPSFDLPEADQPLIPTNNVAPLGAQADSPPDQPAAVPFKALQRAADRVLERIKEGTLDDSDPDLGRLKAAAQAESALVSENGST